MRQYQCYLCHNYGKGELSRCQDCGFYYCKIDCLNSRCHDLCSGDLKVEAYHLFDDDCPHWILDV